MCVYTYIYIYIYIRFGLVTTTIKDNDDAFDPPKTAPKEWHVSLMAEAARIGADARDPQQWLPSGYVNSLLLKMAIEIVDLPIETGDFP